MRTGGVGVATGGGTSVCCEAMNAGTSRRSRRSNAGRTGRKRCERVMASCRKRAPIPFSVLDREAEINEVGKVVRFLELEGGPRGAAAGPEGGARQDQIRVDAEIDVMAGADDISQIKERIANMQEDVRADRALQLHAAFRHDAELIAHIRTDIARLCQQTAWNSDTVENG